MSDATCGAIRTSDSKFYFPKKKKKKDKRGDHMIKCLLTELGRAGRENIWPSVKAHGPRCARSVRHHLGLNIFPSGPPTQNTFQTILCFSKMAFSVKIGPFYLT